MLQCGPRRAAKVIDSGIRDRKIFGNLPHHALNFAVEGDGSIQHIVKDPRGFRTKIKIIDHGEGIFKFFVFLGHAREA